MTNVKAIANRNSIMFKIDTTSIFETATYSSSTKRVGFSFKTSGTYSDIKSLGICYYTTNSSNVTYIQFGSAHYRILSGSCDFPTEAATIDNLSVKVRNQNTYPILCLLEGLQVNTTYHISAYYQTSDDTKHPIGYYTAKTKPAANTSMVFNTTTISSNVPDTTSDQNRALQMKDTVEAVFPTVSKMFNDATNVDATYNPVIDYDSSNWIANSSMSFNSHSLWWENENFRSVIIHELLHNHFISYIPSTSNGVFATNTNVIKFMEFATDCENATWGKISYHYYPIISSARYDYIDDYLVVMATDVDYLFGTNS